MAKRGLEHNGSSKRRGLRGRQQGIADWMSASPDKVLRAVERASFVGGAIRFGYSRDGGAYAVGIYGDGEPYTEFCKPSEDLDDFLDAIIDLYESIGAEQRHRYDVEDDKTPPQGDSKRPK